MAFFKKQTKRGSYNLFSTFSHYLPGFGGMAILFALFIGGSLLGGLLSQAFVWFMGDSQEVKAYSILISYPVSFIPAMLYASVMSRRDEYTTAEVALDGNNFGVHSGGVLAIVVSIATLAAAFVSEPVGQILPDMPEALKKALKMMTEGPVLASLISVSIFAPLFEEWLCRGLILRGLLHRMKPVWAIVISAAFFAVLHLNPWQAIPAFLLGLLFGYVYYKTGSLKLTMLMHCVNNTFSVLMSRVPDFAEAETFMDVLSPWAYAGIYVACAGMLASAIVILKGIPAKNTI